MAIKEVSKKELRLGKKSYGYSAKIIDEFLESGFEAALVEIPEGKTANQVVQTLNSRLKYMKINDKIGTARRGDKVYLIRK